jgi:transcriptional regulator with XRE-family HTH domain
MEMMQIFILNMKKYRKMRKLTQMKLAEMVNTSTSYIGEIEINNKVPSMEMVEKIAKALNVEPFRLFLEEKDHANIVDIDYSKVGEIAAKFFLNNTDMEPFINDLMAFKSEVQSLMVFESEKIEKEVTVTNGKA